MKFRLSSEIVSKCSGVQIAMVVVEGLKPKSVEKIEESVLQAHEFVKGKYSNVEAIDSSEAVATFAKGFESLGVSEGQVSLKSMLELICLKDKKVVLGDPIVDFYNAFVLTHEIPAGGYDLDRIVGDVELRYVVEGDRFKQLNKDKYEAIADTVVFADESEVLCTNWVHKQADTQKIRTRTQNVLFRIEACHLDADEFEAKIKLFEKEFKAAFEYDKFEFVILNQANLEDEVKLSIEAEERRQRFVDYTEILTRGVSDVIVYDDLLTDLVNGKMLRIKHGVDPTTADLHLGYAVNYEKMRCFQERGHAIVFLIGTFTGRFGDPTDKSESRQMRDKKTVEGLANNYLKQLGRILNIKDVEVVYNGDWFDKKSAEDLLRLMSEFTVARMLERDMFQKRMKEGKEIGLHEIVYPVLQGYDSVEIDADLTVIGTDQTFNELQARPLQKARGQEPQNIIAMEMLVGTDGKQKMSQSLGNYIGFDDTPEDKFGKVMSIPDHVILTYFKAVTRVSMEDIELIARELEAGVNPRDIKMRLAHEIVTIYDGEQAAEKAKEHFVTVFQKGEVPDEIAEFRLEDAEITLMYLLVESGLLASTSESRRLIEQGGVKVDGEKVGDSYFKFEGKDEFLVQVGKRKFLKVVL